MSKPGSYSWSNKSEVMAVMGPKGGPFKQPLEPVATLSILRCCFGHWLPLQSVLLPTFTYTLGQFSSREPHMTSAM